MLKEIKLNLGCGQDYKPGWINIDALPRFHPDLVHDLRRKLPFKNNSVDYILAQDILEHLIKDEAATFLKDIFRVLKPGAKLEIRVPDIQVLIDIYAKSPEDFILFTYGETDQTGVWGAHKHGYTKKLLAVLLKMVGFEVITIRNVTTNISCVAKKTKLESRLLNMVVINSKSPHLRERSLAVMKAMSENNINVTFAKSFPFRAKKKIDFIYITGDKEKFLFTFIGVLFKIPIFWEQENSVISMKRSFFALKFILWRILSKSVQKIVTFKEDTQAEVINEGKQLPSKIILFDNPADRSSRKRLSREIVKSYYLKNDAK